MFRKKNDVAERSRSLLKGSATKRVKADILEKLPTLTKEALDVLLPTKDGVEMVKLANRALIYCHVPTKSPMFFDLDGRGTLYPTVYAIWRLQELAFSQEEAQGAACCPSLIVHPPVSKFVLNGADIMLPGVVVRDVAAANFVKGEARCVMSNGNPSPYAVGEMLMGSDGVLQNGMTGKGLKVVHCYLDHLWLMGSRTLPNEGFCEEGVYRVPGSSAMGTQGEVEQDVLVEDADDWEDLAGEAEELREKGDAGESDVGKVGISLTGQDGTGAEAADDKAMTTSCEEDIAEGEGKEEGEGEEESPAVMEDRLRAAFLHALKKGVKDHHLPMLVSKFYSSVLLPFRAPGTSLEIKRTRYRKISTFLGEMEERGLITLKEETKGVQVLVEVNRAHPELRGFKATTDTAPGHAAMATAAVNVVERGTILNKPGRGRGGSGVAGTDISSGREGAGAGVRAFELYRLSHNVKTMLGKELASTRGEYGEYLTPAEARDLLFAYIMAEGLEHPTDRSLVKPNGPLCDNLYKPVNKKAPRTEYPTEVKKSELPRRFLERLLLHHAIILPGETRATVGRGGIPTVSIEVEKRQGNRHATKVRGLEAYGIDPAVFGRQVQKRFACSTSSQPAPGTNGKYQELMLQGHLASELEDLLSKDMGIPRRLLTTAFTKGAKSKKAR